MRKIEKTHWEGEKEVVEEFEVSDSEFLLIEAINNLANQVGRLANR